MALRRQTPTVHCSCCGEPGHNIRACPERPEFRLQRNLFGEDTSRQATEGTTSTIVEMEQHDIPESSRAREFATAPDQIQPPTNVSNEEVNEQEDTPTVAAQNANTWMTPPTSIPGPIMYDQLMMGEQASYPIQGLPPRQPHVLPNRINIRAPTTMAGCTFSTRLYMPTHQRRAAGVHIAEGQKYVNLSDLIVPDTQPTQGSAAKKKK